MKLGSLSLKVVSAGLLMLAVACSSGGSKNDPDVPIDPDKRVIALVDLAMVPPYNGQINQEIMGTCLGSIFQSDGVQVRSMPQSATWTFTVKIDGTITSVPFTFKQYTDLGASGKFDYAFTPDVAGRYEIFATASCNGDSMSTRTIDFTLSAPSGNVIPNVSSEFGIVGGGGRNVQRF
jgi:hypothetical protein